MAKLIEKIADALNGHIWNGANGTTWSAGTPDWQTVWPQKGWERRVWTASALTLFET